MNKAARLFIIVLFLSGLSLKLHSQTPSIDAIIFADLSSIDLAAFALEKDFINQQRIFQVVIMPPDKEITVNIRVVWKKNDQLDFDELVSFHTFPFNARNFFNDEIDRSEIKVNSKYYNTNLLSELVTLGKPGGVFKILLEMFDKDGTPIGNNFNKFGNTMVLLNPTAPSIQLPIEGSSNDVGSIIIQWTQSFGAAGYKILANYLEEDQSPEQALNSANPLINNRDVGDLTSVNMRDILDKELLNGKNIALVVKALVPHPGGQDELPSPIVTFKTNSIGTDSTMLKIQSNPNILLMADFLSGKVNQSFVDKLKNGEITLDQIQITDENNNTVSFSDLISLLTFLNANDQSLISVIYTAR